MQTQPWASEERHSELGTPWSQWPLYAPPTSPPQISALRKQGQRGLGWGQGDEERGPRLEFGGLGAPEDPRLPILHRGVSKVRNAGDKVSV